MIMARRQKWTDAEIATLRRLYPDHLFREIAEILGRSMIAVVVKASKLGLKKPVHPSAIIIPDSELRWLKANFAHLTNKLLCLRLGISEPKLHRIARKHRLTKSAEFMRDSQAFSARKAKESHVRNGTYPPKGVMHPNFAGSEIYRFKPGNKPIRRNRYETLDSKHEEEKKIQRPHKAQNHNPKGK